MLFRSRGHRVRTRRCGGAARGGARREGARDRYGCRRHCEATTLPLLWIGDGEPVDADAVAVAPGNDGAFGELEAVLRVDDEDGLEAALDRHDPAMFLLDVPSRDEDVDPLESVLDLLQNVPAGKLAIAGVEVGNRDEADTLERAGFDAVLASASRIADVVGSEPPEV